ncbi:MAG: DNA polymerase II large subunit [archaeon]
MKKYFEYLKKGVDEEYEVANRARAKGLDPVDRVEIPLAMTMAERAVSLISTIYPSLPILKIVKRILELEEKYGQLNTTVSFVIAREIAEEKFCKFKDKLEAIDAGIRVGFAYMTLGVVASPIEGYTSLKLGKTKRGEDYFIVNFSGPIRSAGTTATCLVLMLIDYLREHFGYAKYDASEEEVKRYIVENTDFHERVSNLQYFPTEEEMEFLASHLPIQIDGEPTSKREVSNYKDLARVETNFIRGGMCLTFSEGLAQKAGKAVGRLNSCKDNGLKCSGFDWLEDYLTLHKKREDGNESIIATYIKDLVAGRPVYGHPSRSGGFRFRYGRSRTAGFSAVSIHPATMGISDGFLSHGTQLKIERPTKGCIITSCDSIDGPIVRLKDGSVRRLSDFEEAKKLCKEVDEIIYLGDILFPLGDVIDRNADLVKPGYVEEWWKLEVMHEVSVEGEVDLDKAMEISRKYGVALYPKFIFYWTQISNEDFNDLIKWMNGAVWRSGKLVLPWGRMVRDKFRKAKRTLEILGVEHSIVMDNVVIDGDARAFLVNLGINEMYNGEILKIRVDDPIRYELNGVKVEVLEIVNEKCEFEIKDKAGSFIGARMGRPEKAKLRKLIGSPNVLFPVSDQGGRLRSIQEAVKIGFVKTDYPIYRCECGNETIYPTCEKCGMKMTRFYFCRECREVSREHCKLHRSCFSFSNRRIDSKHFFEEAVARLGFKDFEVPPLVKGINKTDSGGRDVENLAKGILRAKFNLSVNKDGTIRYDGTEIPLTHFKPFEIRASVEKLRALGYDKDVDGKELVRDDQILELRPHDVVLPSCPETKDEKADDVFFNIANFVDEELEGFYKLPRFYNLEDKDDLIGQLIVCMAPHNCAGVVGRIIGFSKMQGILASPYMHAAVRRDCFGYNTYIPVEKNGEYEIVKIGELVEELNPMNVVDGYGTREKKVEGYICVGFNNKVKEFSVNNFTKHSKSPMYKIKTMLGREIVTTKGHKFFIDGKNKSLGDLKIGDKLSVPLKINIKDRDIEEINLAEFLKDENLMIRGIKDIIYGLDKNVLDLVLSNIGIDKSQFANYNMRDSYPVNFVLALDEGAKLKIFKKGGIATKRDNVEIPIRVKLSDELLEIIGLYIAEGYSRTIGGKKGLNQVYISSSDANMRKFIERVIFDSFGLKKSENKNDRVTFSSRLLYLFFIKILKAGSMAREKRIPNIFLNLKLNRLACVLRGYFEGDGSVSLGDRRVSCDSVSEGLLHDLEFCLSRFGIFSKKYSYAKKPGEKIAQFYIRKGRDVPIFRITKLIVGSDFVEKFGAIGFLSDRKNNILNYHLGRKGQGMRIDMDENFVYDRIVDISFIGEENSYCLNIEDEKHLVVANGIVAKNCDGDEMAVMMLMDVLINFSRKFLPDHRGGSQDAPLILNARIRAGEVDDQILSFETCSSYPLELYKLAERGGHSSEVKIELVRDRLMDGVEPFVGTGWTHDTKDINLGNTNGAYKTLPTMKEKVDGQMELVKKIRAVDTDDVARLILERHFIRDICGNLRKFGRQKFRCANCNEKFRRPPLKGSCLKCGGKIIFTISEGSIKKYLKPAMKLAEEYNISSYTREELELVQDYIESIFGKEEQLRL